MQGGWPRDDWVGFALVSLLRLCTLTLRVAGRRSESFSRLAVSRVYMSSSFVSACRWGRSARILDGPSQHPGLGGSSTHRPSPWTARCVPRRRSAPAPPRRSRAMSCTRRTTPQSPSGTGDQASFWGPRRPLLERRGGDNVAPRGAVDSRDGGRGPGVAAGPRRALPISRRRPVLGCQGAPQRQRPPRGSLSVTWLRAGARELEVGRSPSEALATARVASPAEPWAAGARTTPHPAQDSRNFCGIRKRAALRHPSRLLALGLAP